MNTDTTNPGENPEPGPGDETGKVDPEVALGGIASEGYDGSHGGGRLTDDDGVGGPVGPVVEDLNEKSPDEDTLKFFAPTLTDPVVHAPVEDFRMPLFPEEGQSGATPLTPLFADSNRLHWNDAGQDPDGEGREEVNPLDLLSLDGNPDLDLDPDRGEFPGDFHPTKDVHPRGDREEQPRRHRKGDREHGDRREHPERPNREEHPRPEPEASGGPQAAKAFAWVKKYGFFLWAGVLLLLIVVLAKSGGGGNGNKDDKDELLKQPLAAQQQAVAESGKSDKGESDNKKDVEGAQVVDFPVNTKVVLNAHGTLEVIGSPNVHLDKVIFKAAADGPGSEVNNAVDALMSAHGLAIGVSGLDPNQARGLVSNTLDSVGRSLDRTAQSMEQLVNATKDVADANIANAKANQANADANVANSEKLDDVVGVLREGFSGLGVKMTPGKE